MSPTRLDTESSPFGALQRRLDLLLWMPGSQLYPIRCGLATPRVEWIYRWLLAGVACVEVRQRVMRLFPVHLDRDPAKVADPRHSHIVSPTPDIETLCSYVNIS
jgi:hypothetical protein